jgi:hypothetical protein
MASSLTEAATSMPAGPVAGPNLKALWASASAATYSSASAHDPKFADKAVWPMLTGKEQYTKTQWPKVKLYVWAHPGTNGQWGNRAGLDPTDPKNWLVDGKPATEIAFGESADLLLPASDKPYSIGFRGNDKKILEQFRHVTIEKNAALSGGGDGVGRTIYGNMWVKKGGNASAQGATRFIGGLASFVRNDNDVPDDKLQDGINMMSQYFEFDKGQASVELLGYITVLDEYRVNGGTMIVGADTIMHPGRSAEPSIAKGGTMALLDGAYWGKWTNEFHRARDLTVAGVLQGGLPDRPLTRDCTVGLSFRNWQKLDFTKWSPDPKKGIKDIRLVSMVVASGGQVRAITSDPAKACLNITWTGIERTNVIGDPRAKDDKGLGMFKDADFAKQFNSIPRKITVYFESGAMLENVRFDNVHPGGLLMKDTADRGKWKNVMFGPNNSGKPDELFKQLDLPRVGNY